MVANSKVKNEIKVSPQKSVQEDSGGKLEVEKPKESTNLNSESLNKKAVDWNVLLDTNKATESSLERPNFAKPVIKKPLLKKKMPLKK